MLKNIKNKSIKQDLDDIITYALKRNSDGDKIENVIKYIEELESFFFKTKDENFKKMLIETSDVIKRLRYK